MGACNHPRCPKIARKNFCGRHWHALTEDLQHRMRRCKSTSEKGALLQEAREYFAERMIGDLEITTCNGRPPDYKGCGADIVWLVTAAGKNMPVEADGPEEGDAQYDPTRHTPHWASCPYAKEFRR